MRRACRACGRVHPSDSARAVGRFTGRMGYRAAYPDSPIRETRAQAEADWCDHHRRKNTRPAPKEDQ